MAPPRSSVSFSSTPSSQSHSYYQDIIPDTTLLTSHPTLAAIVAKHGSPKVMLPTRKTVGAVRSGMAVANTRFNASPFARKALRLDPDTDPNSACPSTSASNTRPSPSPALPWTETDVTIPTRDGSSIALRIYQPSSSSDTSNTTGPEETYPVVMMFHMGAQIFGNLATEALLCRLFTTRLRALVIDVDFRLYPDVDFPVPVLDCQDAILWAARNASTYHGDCAKGFVLAGVSAGGAAAAICAHIMRDDGTVPAITGQWLSCPVMMDDIEDSSKNGNGKSAQCESRPKTMFDRTAENRSHEQNRNALLVNGDMDIAIQQLVKFDYSSRYLSPFMWPDHCDLGRGGVYVQVAGQDPWRDSGRIYAGLCQRDGASVRLDVYPGVPHCWWTRYSQVEITQKWVEDSVTGMREILRQGLTAGKEQEVLRGSGPKL